jgi:hypothetical protein
VEKNALLSRVDFIRRFFSYSDKADWQRKITDMADNVWRSCFCHLIRFDIDTKGS